MTGLRSLRNKVSLLFFLITAAAFASIYFVVVPQLEQNLKERRLGNLEAEAKAAQPVLEALVSRRRLHEAGRASSPRGRGQHRRAGHLPRLGRAP